MNQEKHYLNDAMFECLIIASAHLVTKPTIWHSSCGKKADYCRKTNTQLSYCPATEKVSNVTFSWFPITQIYTNTHTHKVCKNGERKRVSDTREQETLLLLNPSSIFT